jgi:phosphotransferase system enzyme I (PtsI)
MAGDPLMVPLLLGLGVDELSVAPQAVPQIKYLIRRIKLSEAREVAEAALRSEETGEILERSQRLVRSVAPSLFEQ